MVQSVSAPAKTTQTLEGLVMAKACTGGACVLSQVEFHIRLYEDGTGHIACWQPLDPAKNAQAICEDPCETAVVARMIEAIAKLSPTEPDVP